MHVITIREPGAGRVCEEASGELSPGRVRIRTICSGFTAYRVTNPYSSRKWDNGRRLFVAGITHAWPLSVHPAVRRGVPEHGGAAPHRLVLGSEKGEP
ncbi:hypothetical protein GCM10009560_56720 [Nonomuraea longicatena]|uniref:Uncharacterized protein n=1 Tax=Nonomuraea longicatena TaxID=83682 RepID=A0ABP4AYR0_9ACTN